MTEMFGIEGGGNQGAAKGEQPKKEGYTGEGPEGQYMQYDNEVGAMMLNLPAHVAKYKADLQEDLMDAFYGDAAGGKDQHQTINAWIADWIRKKEDEDPDFRRPT